MDTKFFKRTCYHVKYWCVKLGMINISHILFNIDMVYFTHLLCIMLFLHNHLTWFLGPMPPKKFKSTGHACLKNFDFRDV